MDWFANPIILYPLLLLMYVGLPLLGLFVLYKLYQLVRRGRSVDFTGIPALTTVTTKNLPKATVSQLEAINTKAEKLLNYYNTKQIKDEAIMGESQFLVKKILNEDLPEAIADYQRLDNTRANQMAVGTTGKTAYQLLTDYLTTINEQFDEMLDAMYEQNAQKLLISNRYLQARFDNQDSELNVLMSAAKPPPVAAIEQQATVVVPPASMQPTDNVSVSIDKSLKN